MHKPARALGLLALATSAVTLSGIAGAAAAPAAVSGTYAVTPLVSDQAGMAPVTDANLVNPWGLASAPIGPLWVANNHSSTATVYAAPFGSKPTVVPLVVKIRGGDPSGEAFNPSAAFMVKGLPATFLFDSEAGDITAWNPLTGTSTVIVKKVPNAIFKGLALGTSGTGQPLLYATDFHNNTVLVFDGKFHPVTTPGAFVDPTMPAGFAPFNIATINGAVDVTYAKQDADAEDDTAGPHLGYLDQYSKDGVLIHRLVSGGLLDAPWALTLAPKGFGKFAGDLLIGNFGDGRITAVDPTSGKVLGQLTTSTGTTVGIDGLWGLTAGTGLFGKPSGLIFSAGPLDEAHGLLGTIDPS